MNGHIGIPTGDETGKTTTSKTPLDDDADVRDIITGLASKGKGLDSQELSKYAMRLAVLIGKPAAQKLVNHILIFNQRGDVQNKTPQERIEQFYNMGAVDKDTDKIIAKAKSFGTGIQSGMRQSPDILNIEASGRKLGDKTNAGEADKIKTVAANTLQN